jgi:hypothetical protein
LIALVTTVPATEGERKDGGIRRHHSLAWGCSGKRAAEGVLDNMRQLGMDVHDLCLWKHGIHGNGHVPMVERNSCDVASFVIDWLTQRVET